MKFLFDQKANTIHELEFSGYECIFVGETPLDDRTAVALDYINENFPNVRVVSIGYESLNFVLRIDGEEVSIHDLSHALAWLKSKCVLIESTLLDFSEIILILTEIYGHARQIDFLYLTPEEYGRIRPTSLNSRVFKLSKSFKSLSPIPGFTPMLNNGAKLVSFVGFESGRLGRVLSEDENATIKKLSVVFAVPPFVSGWENYSLFQHAGFLEDPIAEDAQFVSAFSPFSAYSLLVKKIEPSLAVGEVIQLAPYGTKPTSIGVAVYAVEKFLQLKSMVSTGIISPMTQVSIKYDFPEKAEGRSVGVGSVYLYRLSS